MSIELVCNCGKRLKVPETLAGKKVRCPQCQQAVRVTAPAPNEDAESQALEALLSDDAPRSSPAATEPKEAPRNVAAKAPVLDLPEPYRPSKSVAKKLPKPKQDSGPPAIAFEEGWFGSMNSGIVGGILMMIIAVVWFVAGLAANRIFFYPPILFFIGLVALVKGFFDRGK